MRTLDGGSHGHDLFCVTRIDQPQELPQAVLLDDRIAQRKIGIQPVQVAAPFAASLDVARVL
jgi:hypothetical protein